jgi:GTP diphosphokinase / guanosine-3',5'-bis(diphosphate) 3'-diphosphatase
MSIEKIITTVKKFYPKADTDMIQLAFDFASKAHEGQKRSTGEKYITHCLATAQTLAELELPPTVVIAGLLHDVPEDTDKTIQDVEDNFGEEVASIVKGITKLSNIKYRGMDRYIENLRKMFIAMAEDIRVIIVKFADRLHNLSTLYALPANKQKRIALESLEIYAPIANRLGIGELQARLEDLAFQYAYPEEYIWVEQLIKQRTPAKEKTLNQMIAKLTGKMKEDEIKHLEIYGRKKHFYSSYRKLLRFNRNINQIYDIVAIRVLVESVADCYAVMGIVHSIWKPVKGRIKDYIAQPKPNGYQSLHTTVFGENQEIVEFQIRTREMNDQAEYGIAAYWKYKEGKTTSENIKKEVAWVQELVKWLKEVRDNEKFIEGAKIDVFQNHIFVFTPQGEVIDLPEGATPIDFAYHIHTDIGDKCHRAMVNNIQVSLDTKLKNGDVVQIITDKNRKGPNPEWLKFVKTRMAKQRISIYKNQSWKNIITKFSKDKK